MYNNLCNYRDYVYCAVALHQ